MSESFRYDRDRLDERLLGWVHASYSDAVRNLDEIAGRPGFVPSELDGAGYGPELGPVTRELQALVYWLFIAGSVIFHPAVGTHAKSVLVVRVNVDHQSPGSSYLQVGATVGDHLESILVPVPRLPAAILGKEKTDFAGSRAALHDAAIRLTGRVNLVWPSVVAMSALNHVSDAQS